MNKQLYLTIACLLILCQCILAQTAKISNPVLAGFYPDPSICRASGKIHPALRSGGDSDGRLLQHGRMEADS